MHLYLFYILYIWFTFTLKVFICLHCLDCLEKNTHPRISMAEKSHVLLVFVFCFCCYPTRLANCSFSFCRIPGKTYMIIAFLTVGTMGLSNTSLGYLNYPTQVIFKCCKLIPVMIGGVFIQGKWQKAVDLCLYESPYS